MNRKVILFAGLLLVITVAIWVYFNFLKTEPHMSRQEPAYRMNAVELYSAFENDESKANNLYQNQIIELKGEVEAVEIEEGSKPVISLKTEGFGSIKVTLADQLELSELKTYQDKEVRVRGECIGILLDVLMVNSIILKE